MLESRWLECKRPGPMLRFLADKASARKLRLFVCACCRRLWPWLTNDASRQAIEALERQADSSGPLKPTKAVRELAHRGADAVEERRQTAQTALREARARRSKAWASIWVGDPPEPSILVRSAAEAEEASAHEQEADAVVQAVDLIVSLAEQLHESEATAEEAVRIVVRGRAAVVTRARATRWMHRADEEAERPVTRSRAAVRAAQAAQWIERQEEAGHERGKRLDARVEKAERRAQCALIRDLFGNPFRPVAIDPAWLDGNEGCAVKMARAIYDERKFSEMPILADALEEAGCDQADILEHCRQPGEHARGCWVLDLLLGRT